MPFDLTLDCKFTGPALPEPFVKFNLEAELNKRGLLPKTTGPDGRALAERWQFIRRKLGALVSHGGGLRVQHHVIEPLLPHLGYARIELADEIQTREGAESGGALLLTEDGTTRLRVWCVDLDADLDAPARRGDAYRFSHLRIAQRVLLTTGSHVIVRHVLSYAESRLAGVAWDGERLYAYFADKTGYTLKGTFSSSVDPAGDKLYITWNNSRGSKAWDSCVLTVIHILESERQ